MRKLNNEIKIDRANCAVENASKEAMQPASQTTESPAEEKKSPLTPKRIGLIALTFLLVTGILLMPIRVTQNEAKAADPVTMTVIVTSAATFIVLTALRWVIGRSLTAAERRLLNAASRKNPPEAYVSVIGAHWTTNYYNWTRKTDSWDLDNEEWTGNWTTKNETASQGDYKLTNPVGTNEDGTAMSDSWARFLLSDAKYTTKQAQIELLDADGFLIKDVWVRGREDAFEERKKVKLKQLKEDYGDDVSWGAEWDIIITTRKVGDYKMESIFPSPTAWPQLAHRESEEDGGNKYQGHLHWKYQEINETGDTAGYTDDGMGIWQAEEKKGRELIDFLSYTYSPASHPACGDNQVLTEAPHINDGVTRTFEVENIKGEGGSG